MADIDVVAVESCDKNEPKLRYTVFTEKFSNSIDNEKDTLSLQEAFRIYREAKQVRSANFNINNRTFSFILWTGDNSLSQYFYDHYVHMSVEEPAHLTTYAGFEEKEKKGTCRFMNMCINFDF